VRAAIALQKHARFLQDLFYFIAHESTPLNVDDEKMPTMQ